METEEQEEFESFLSQSYSDNFLSKELKNIMAQQKQENTIWLSSGFVILPIIGEYGQLWWLYDHNWMLILVWYTRFGSSNWHQLLKYHGNGQVPQHGPNPEVRTYPTSPTSQPKPTQSSQPKKKKSASKKKKK